MTDTALTNRLRQQSRRAGLMVGVTMALTIGLCIGGFALIFNVLAPFTDDFYDREATARPSATTSATEAPNATEAPAQAEVELTVPPAPAPTQPQPTAPAIVPQETSTAFRATHASNSRFSINLRSEPNTSSEVVTVLEPSTPLQFVDERTGNEATDWLRFRTEQGEEGWIRQIDVDAVTPGA